MTGDAKEYGIGTVYPCFEHSGKRGFDIRKEGHGKQKVHKEKSAKADKVQPRKPRAKKQSARPKKALQEILQ
jgi:hypothetical protein